MKTSNWEFTKIVATIGPASDSVETLEKMLLAGMNVARLNTKHGTTEWHAERIDRIRQAAKNVDKPVGILLDLQGPEIRINVPNHQAFELEENETVPIRAEFSGDEPKQIQIPANVIEALNPGDEVSTEDGFCEFEVVKKMPGEIIVKAKNYFTVGDRKTMNTPGVIINMPSLTKDDLMKLDAAVAHPVDFVGLSFVRNQKDIERLQGEMKSRNIKASIIAKIENQAAIDHLDEIIEVSDGIMVARGDLAVEIPMEQLTYWQKEMIKRCRSVGKPVITATQMLKSMVEHPRPTRAEVSDVANAVFDGTDAVMLSEETTIGKYPVKTVATMRKIVTFNEQHSLTEKPQKSHMTRTSAVTKMAISLIHDHLEDINQVLVLTETGQTANQLSRHRPLVPVIAVTDQEKTLNLLCLQYGVYPVFYPFPEGKIEHITKILEELKEKAYIRTGQHLLVIHGTIYKRPGQTNTVSVIDVD